MLKQWLQFHIGASFHFTITLIPTFVMKTKSIFFLAWSQQNPVLLALGQSNINVRGSFQMLNRRCLVRISFTIAAWDSLLSLCMLMSQAVFSRHCHPTLNSDYILKNNKTTHLLEITSQRALFRYHLPLLYFTVILSHY